VPVSTGQIDHGWHAARIRTSMTGMTNNKGEQIMSEEDFSAALEGYRAVMIFTGSTLHGASWHIRQLADVSTPGEGWRYWYHRGALVAEAERLTTLRSMT